MRANGHGRFGKDLKIHMAGQVGFARAGQRRVEFMPVNGLQRIAEAGDQMAIIDGKRGAAVAHESWTPRPA
jgi:hypothetical protein